MVAAAAARVVVAVVSVAEGVSEARWENKKRIAWLSGAEIEGGEGEEGGGGGKRRRGRKRRLRK